MEWITSIVESSMGLVRIFSDLDKSEKGLEVTKINEFHFCLVSANPLSSQALVNFSAGA